MKVFIITLGTRGDVQPYVALGKGLRAAGHVVTVCTSVSFAPAVTAHGLDHGYMNDDVPEFVASDEGRRLMESTTGMLQWAKAARALARRAGEMHRRMLSDGWEAARRAGPDLIIYHPKAFGGPHYAEELGVPAVQAVAMPLLVPTRAFPAIGMPPWELGGWYNRLTYALFGRLTAQAFGRSVVEWRAARGLPPRGRSADMLRTTAGAPIPVLHGFSRHVVPRPADWPETAAVTGYWSLDGEEAWEPPDRLRRFLDAGEPPVYVGFGSMAGRDPRRLARLVVEASRKAGVRAILATGWGGLAGADDLPKTVLAIDEAPHGWLFPRTAAVVHHGGAGTTGAGLRAGRPTVVCPFIGDQTFWGRRVRELGAGGEPIPQKRLTAGRLAAAIREVTTSRAIRASAEALGAKIRAEDGVAGALAALAALGVLRPAPPPGGPEGRSAG